MLLKVSDGNGGWILFDNCGPVHIRKPGKQVTSAEGLRGLEQEGGFLYNLVPRTAFTERQQVAVGIVDFDRGGQACTALFTGVAWVCNDTGDTLERVDAGVGNFRKRG